jgi:hypothetical protein
MITLWITAILVIFALGLGHRAAISLKLARYQKDRLKAYYLAKAGINKAIAILKEDAQDPQTQDYDSIKACGVNLKSKEPQDIFSQNLGSENDNFVIGYYDATKTLIYGMREEEGKININTTGNANFDRAKVLVLLNTREIENAGELTDMIMNWIKTDSQIDISKKEPLTAPEELLVVLEYFYQSRGDENFQDKANDTFNGIKDLFTVFGPSSGKININTASKDTLAVLAKAVDNEASSTLIDSLIKQIIDFREGETGPFITQSAIDNFMNALTNNDERETFGKMRVYLEAKSDYFRVNSRGEALNITRDITLVYDRSNGKIVYWHEN